MSYMTELGARSLAAKPGLACAGTRQKNQALAAIAAALRTEMQAILNANAKDLENAEAAGMNKIMMDRLRLTEARIQGIASSVEELIALEDPVGLIESGSTRPNGLRIVKIRVPLGVVGIIFESRPNVVVDAACLCLKSGNVSLLRGGKEAIHSNTALMQVMRRAVESVGLPADIMQLVENTGRDIAQEMMRLNGYIDVLIPRGGAGLIQAVIQNSSLPVIETGTGNCHIYVDASADLDMAAAITNNAKVSRPSVCNAAESLLVHADVAEQFLPMVKNILDASHVVLYGCPRTCAILSDALPATEEDYAAEYLDFKMSVKVVDSLEEAIDHIAKYSTHHSDSIITRSLESAERFTQAVDSAAVYVNASTRFTDGGEFGLGAEIGISTQKLHARGPMGLKELTTIKYIIHGEGQIR